MKIFKKLTFAAIAGLAVVTLASCGDKKPANQISSEEFRNLQNELFLDYLGNDAMAWMTFTLHPEDFGYERPADYEAKWYSYSKTTTKDIEDAVKEIGDFKAELESYDLSALTQYQKYEYDSMYTYIYKLYKAYDGKTETDMLIDLDFITSQGGYVADLTSSLGDYYIRTENDAKDVVSYVKSTRDAFASYLEYAKDKEEAGYPLIDSTVDGMIDYLDELEKDKDDYYLVETIGSKIDACDAITSSKKTEYKEQLDDAFANYFFPAVASLKEGLAPYLGKTTNTSYLSAAGQKGKDLYKEKLESRLGFTNLDMEEYEAFIDSQLERYETAINNTMASAQKMKSSMYNLFASYVQGSEPLVTDCTTPEQMIAWLKEFAKTCVPDLKTQPTISFKYMNDTEAEISNTVAYYRKSALDDTTSEVITYNPKNTSNVNDMLVTTGHEGYPGHLYAYCYLKEQDASNFTKVHTNTGFGEGWAVYVEYLITDYIRSRVPGSSASEKKAAQLACDYLKYNAFYGFLLYTKLDLDINYKGKTLSQIRNEYSDIFNDVTSVYELLVEIPSEYAPYGFGSARMVTLHEEAKKALGAKYNEVAYNAAILKYGWPDFETAIKISNDFIEANK